MKIKSFFKKNYFLVFLKVLGLEPMYVSKIYPNFDTKKRHCFKTFFNWFYPFLVFLLVSFKPIFETIICLKYYEAQKVSDVLFNYIPPVHYLLSFRYFRNQRRKRIYESGNMDFLKNDEGISKFMLSEKNIARMIVVFLVIFAIEKICSTLWTAESEIYTDLSDLMYIISKGIIYISVFPSNLILLINGNIFLFSFFQQVHKLQELKKKLQIKEWKENKKSSVALLCYEIIDVRYTISRLIKKTEPMYTSTTVIGGIYIGLMIEFRNWGYENVKSFIIFFIVQICFFTIVHYIDECRCEINDVVHSREFASKYILRKNDFCQSCFDIEKRSLEIKSSVEDMSKLEKDIEDIMGKDYEEKEKSPVKLDIPVSIISKSLTESKSPIFNKRNLGNNIDNSDDLDFDISPVILERVISKNDVINHKKNTTIDISPILGKRRLKKENINRITNSFSKYENVNDSMEDSVEMRKNMEEFFTTRHTNSKFSNSNVYLTTDEYVRCIYEWSTNTGSSVDWIILTNLLNENWSSFGLMGIQFANGKALAKAIFVTSTLIASGSIFGVIQNIIL